MEVGLVVLCLSRMINTCIFITLAAAKREGAVLCDGDDGVKDWKRWHSSIISFTNRHTHSQRRYSTTWAHTSYISHCLTDAMWGAMDFKPKQQARMHLLLCFVVCVQAEPGAVLYHKGKGR